MKSRVIKNKFIFNNTMIIATILNNKNWLEALAEDWRLTKNWQPGWIYKLKAINEEIYVGAEIPQEKGWVQDQDTLDTWFSTGLWTFSTLGWPKLTKDLKTYHPTSVLETMYDILFFWVARMIIMSTYFMKEVPFKTVYLHAMVKDKQGRKMSKSLNNGIDPLEMIKKYGDIKPNKI